MRARHAAVVLCGGRSSRMGRAKAWLPWRGRPMLAHVVHILREVVDDVVVVTSAELDPPPVPARVVRDPEPELGPLAGIAEGLAHTAAELAFVSGTDAPYLTAAFVRALLACGGAAAPELNGFVQTLAAVYPPGACARALALLGQGRRRPLDLLEALGYRRLSERELPDPGSVRGFNTPEAYLAAVKEDDAAARATLELVGHAPLELPVGHLAELLARAPRELRLLEGERIAPGFRVSLGGRERVNDPRVPIGPGERVTVSAA